MCMLCVVPPNVIPSREKLENSALNNPHGFGFAIVIPKEDRILVEHSMNADDSINRFIEARGKYPEGYAMWHARFATHGSTTLDNCHPFKVGSDSKSYLAHNGVLSIIEPKGDFRSDTRIFAEDLLPHMGGVPALDNVQLWNLLEDFTNGSKVCVLTLNPNAKYQCYLLHEEKGWKDDSGVWWSNDSCYLGNERWYSKQPLGFLTSNSGDFDFVDGYCVVCEEELKEEYGSYCNNCGTCQDCWQLPTDCLCYEPAKKGESIDVHPSWMGW